jgi:hypothetical protein
MVKVDAIEGTVGDSLWCHYDIANDTLYLRLAKDRNAPTYAEETPDGFLLLRREDDDQIAGLTVVSWWKRFGHGTLPDSLKELAAAIEPWADKLAA